jgi:L-lactate dehydrogenase complex protein LldF
VYTRTGGHAYGSVYPGPIGAILTPQLIGVENAASLPYASTLCGACYEVCPVKIDIPTVLLHLRSKVVEQRGATPERHAMRATRWIFGSGRRLRFAQRLGRIAQVPLVRGGSIRRLPGPLSGWTRARNLRPVARESFRDWWSKRP